MEQKCQCGCGQITPIYNQTNSSRGIKRGEHARFIKGHGTNKSLKGKISETLCECGCGEFTFYASHTSHKGQQRKGVPLRFISGHNTTRGQFEIRDGINYKNCVKHGWQILEEAFYIKDGSFKRGNCKKCIKDYHDSEEYIESRKDYDWRRRWERHGKTLEEFIIIYELQNKKCRFCEIKVPMKDLRVDHDHKCCSGDWSCGKCVRGLLCIPHNLGLGNFQDDPIGLQAAIDYILEFNSKFAKEDLL